jgi:hypothetical protein
MKQSFIVAHGWIKEFKDLILAAKLLNEVKPTFIIDICEGLPSSFRKSWVQFANYFSFKDF